YCGFSPPLGSHPRRSPVQAVYHCRPGARLQHVALDVIARHPINTPRIVWSVLRGDRFVAREVAVAQAENRDRAAFRVEPVGRFRDARPAVVREKRHRDALLAEPRTQEPLILSLALAL